MFSEVPVISPAIRASIDKMCFQAPFCTKTYYEKKVPANIRRDFDKYIMRRHTGEEALSEFGAAWTKWLDEQHQTALSDMESDDDDDDDDDDKPRRFSTSAFGVVGSDSEAEGPTPPASPEGSQRPASPDKPDKPPKSPAKPPKSPAK